MAAPNACPDGRAQAREAGLGSPKDNRGPRKRGEERREKEGGGQGFQGGFEHNRMRNQWEAADPSRIGSHRRSLALPHCRWAPEALASVSTASTPAWQTYHHEFQGLERVGRRSWEQPAASDLATVFEKKGPLIVCGAEQRHLQAWPMILHRCLCLPSSCPCRLIGPSCLSRGGEARDRWDRPTAGQGDSIHRHPVIDFCRPSLDREETFAWPDLGSGCPRNVPTAPTPNTQHPTDVTDR